MKVESMDDLWVVAEIWYQRTRKLSDITQDESESSQRKTKAFKLFMIMFGRINEIIPLLIKSITPKMCKYESGGIINKKA